MITIFYTYGISWKFQELFIKIFGNKEILSKTDFFEKIQVWESQKAILAHFSVSRLLVVKFEKECEPLVERAFLSLQIISYS